MSGKVRAEVKAISSAKIARAEYAVIIGGVVAFASVHLIQSLRYRRVNGGRIAWLMNMKDKAS